jgi:hypothetical protein
MANNGWQNIESENGGKLVLHTGGQVVERKDLDLIPLPEATESYTPVSHLNFLETLEAELAERQVSIVRETYALKQEGRQLFGVLDLSTVAPTGDFRSVIGFRNSYDKTWAAGLVAGSRVFVCDNLAFSGEMVMLNKKHTKNLSMNREIPGAVNRWEDHFGLLCGLTDHMKGVNLIDVQAKEILIDTFLGGGLPIKILPAVAKEYFEPTYADFEARTAWSLYNAYTHAAKEIKSEHSRTAFLANVTRLVRKAVGYRMAEAEAGEAEYEEVLA